MGNGINQYQNFFDFFFIPHLYYDFSLKDEHECTQSVHDKSSKGNYNTIFGGFNKKITFIA